MKKPDEIALWNKVKDLPCNEPIEWEKIFKELDILPGRGFYITEKWNDKGIINYGVSLRYAWKESDKELDITT